MSKPSTGPGSSRNRIIVSPLSAALIAALLMGGEAATDKPPWQRRTAGGFDSRHNLSYQSIGAEVWPEEPASPHPVEPSRFKEALSALCGRMPPDRLDRYAAAILEESEHFGVDPFVVGALVHHQSGCLPKTPDKEIRRGLTRIDVSMHAPHIRSGEYRYFQKRDGAWVPRALRLDKYPFNQWKAERALSNIYFAAGILKVLTEQCRDLDNAFDGLPHRHPVSHWFFGDKVRSTEPEDAVLTVRRRLIQYYSGAGPAPAGEFRGIALVSPLDGSPRLVIDYFGNKRGIKKGPGHQGIDLAGLTGEPVRSVAGGRVVFAGVDMPAGQESRQTTPEQASAFPRNSMGKGGIWVTVNHGNGFRTSYMHLDALMVKERDEVEAGQAIGTLGNSGTSSGPHLHLEFRTDKGGREDPAIHLKKALVDPFTRKSSLR